MFLISITQVISETNYGLLMEISGGFPRQHCGPPDVGETPLLTLTKKLFYHSNRAKYLDCPYIYPYSKNYSEIPIFRGGNSRLKILSIDLALRRQDVCLQPRGDSPSPQISRELLRRPIGSGSQLTFYRLVIVQATGFVKGLYEFTSESIVFRPIGI